MATKSQASGCWETNRVCVCTSVSVGWSWRSSRVGERIWRGAANSFTCLSKTTTGHSIGVHLKSNGVNGDRKVCLHVPPKAKLKFLVILHRPSVQCKRFQFSSNWRKVQIGLCGKPGNASNQNGRLPQSYQAFFFCPGAYCDRQAYQISVFRIKKALWA